MSSTIGRSLVPVKSSLYFFLSDYRSPPHPSRARRLRSLIEERFTYIPQSTPELIRAYTNNVCLETL